MSLGKPPVAPVSSINIPARGHKHDAEASSKTIQFSLDNLRVMRIICTKQPRRYAASVALHTALTRCPRRSSQNFAGTTCPVSFCFVIHREWSARLCQTPSHRLQLTPLLALIACKGREANGCDSNHNRSVCSNFLYSNSKLVEAKKGTESGSFLTNIIKYGSPKLAIL